MKMKAPKMKEDERRKENEAGEFRERDSFGNTFLASKWQRSRADA